MHEKALETNSELKIQFLQFIPFLIASLLTGLVAFLYSRLFSYSEALSFYIYKLNPILIFIVTPLTFLLSWWMVKKFAPYARGSGIPQVMASLELAKPKTQHIISKFLGLRIILVKILSSCIKVVGGGVAGREGPTIQIASSIFNQVHKLLPEWYKPVSQKNMLIAGAASGLAAAFNTPLGGIIFAIEELSRFHIRYYKSPLFIAVIVAGLTAQGIGGSYLYLGYPKTVLSGFIVYPGMFLVAVASGFFGSKMCVILLRFMRFFGSIKSHWSQVAMIILCAWAVSVPIYIFGTETMGSGKEIMERILFSDEKTVDWFLPFVRMSSLIASFGFGGAGGVFAPSLSTGATMGAAVAQLLDLSGANGNILILIGMTAFLTGVTRAPFTSSIIIFEMTDRHSIIFFLLLGALVANMIARFTSKASFYDVLKDNYIIEAKMSEKVDQPGKSN